MNTARAYADDIAPRGGGLAKRDGATRSPRRSFPVKVVRAFEEREGAVLGSRALSLARRPETHPAEGEPRRWAAFLALAEVCGVTAEEVIARFSEDDITDLCAPEHDEAMLARCMDTLAESVRRERAAALAGLSPHDEAGRAEPCPRAVPVRQVRCADCRHFRRRASHPHLGECDGGVPRTAVSGFWDDQRRGCGTFVPSGA